MWPDRRLIELLQIEHPLVLGPMAGIGTIELAASAFSRTRTCARSLLLAAVTVP